MLEMGAEQLIVSSTRSWLRWMECPARRTSSSLEPQTDPTSSTLPSSDLAVWISSFTSPYLTRRAGSASWRPTSARVPSARWHCWCSSHNIQLYKNNNKLMVWIHSRPQMMWYLLRERIKRIYARVTFVRKSLEYGNLNLDCSPFNRMWTWIS